MGSTANKIKSLKQDPRGKHCVVTGSNSGLGYCKMGAKVTMACRSEDRGKAALEKLRQEALQKPVKERASEDVDVQVKVLDLGSLQSVVDFAKRFRIAGVKVDILINNAGVMAIPERKETVDSLEMHIGGDDFGGHLLTRLMEPCIVDGGRVMFVSSIAHRHSTGMPATRLDWENINFEKPDTYMSWQAYGRSKLANIFDAKEFAKTLAPRGLTTYAAHPGVANTDLFRNTTYNSLVSRMTRVLAPLKEILLDSALKGSLTTLRCSIDPALGTPEVSGKYCENLKEEKPSTLALDPANPPRYWAIAEKIFEEKLGKKGEDVIPK